MRTRRYALAIAFVVALAVVWRVTVGGQSQGADAESKVDAVFAKWTPSTPGCAVGVATNGKPALAKGYGSAELRHWYATP